MCYESLKKDLHFWSSVSIIRMWVEKTTQLIFKNVIISRDVRVPSLSNNDNIAIVDRGIWYDNNDLFTLNILLLWWMWTLSPVLILYNRRPWHTWKHDEQSLYNHISQKSSIIIVHSMSNWWIYLVVDNA